MQSSFNCQGYTFSRFWHCFGNHNHRANLKTVLGLLEESKTNVIPINTHRLDNSKSQDTLEIGYDGVPFSILSENMDTTPYIKMLNINLQTTAKSAVEKTKLAYSILGFPIIKLEVLDETRQYSKQDEIVIATKELIQWDKNLMVCPLFSNDYDTARRLIDEGAPLLRVMGSGIGCCDGINDRDTFEKICTLGVPVILDGGIGKVQDALDAIDSGASGVLINSMLFKQDKTPVDVMSNFSKQFHSYIENIDEPSMNDAVV